MLGFNETVAGVSDATAAGVIENMETEVLSTNSTLTVSSATNSSFNGFMRSRAGGTGTGTLNLTKGGSGALTLSGANITYTGATSVNGGQLLLFNAMAYNSPTTVNSGAKLSWSGSANVQNNNTADTILLNDGATLENLNPANYTVLNGAVTVASGANVTIN